MFGLTSFAKWYYGAEYQSFGQTRLASNTTFSNGAPAQDDLARELLYWGFDQTRTANDDITTLDVGSKNDFSTATDLFASILVTEQPQLVVLGLNGSYKQPAPLHSVLVYSYSTDTVKGVVHFSFYDPNVPLIEQVLDYNLAGKSFSLPAYTDVFNTSYSWVYFSAASTFMDPTDFLGAFDDASNGWPNPKRHFKEILIDPNASTQFTLVSSEGPDPVATPAVYTVLPGSTTLWMD